MEPKTQRKGATYWENLGIEFSHPTEADTEEIVKFYLKEFIPGWLLIYRIHCGCSGLVVRVLGFGDSFRGFEYRPRKVFFLLAFFLLPLSFLLADFVG